MSRLRSILLYVPLVHVTLSSMNQISPNMNERNNRVDFFNRRVSLFCVMQKKLEPTCVMHHASSFYIP